MLPVTFDHGVGQEVLMKFASTYNIVKQPAVILDIRILDLRYKYI